MSDVNTSLSAQPGHCYVVATPIGNLADLSDRARGILGTVSVIASEDTRTTGAMLQRLGLHRPLVAYHEHNEATAAEQLVARLAAGESVAIVSDAGTPGLSDPGFRLVRACRRRNLPVVPVPGACAAIAVLSASGLPTNAFFFAGFLPAKTAARRTFLEKQREADHTLCLYESTHRIEAFVDEIVEVLGEKRVVCLAKEVTKLHEMFLVGPAAEVRQRFTPLSKKGEYVVLIAPPDFEL
jgi:16S rRNA (cytidine1402-2'-O)-methyltransferase